MLTAVTGASGHLGGAVVRALLAAGRSVRAVDLHKGETLRGLDVEFVETDILDGPSLQRAFYGVEVVYHLAAMIAISGEPAEQVWRLNVDGVRNVAEVALRAGAKRLVHCSSVHAYDLEKVTEVTETSPRTLARSRPVYDQSKAAGEVQLRTVMDQGLDAVIVNPTGIIGPLDFAPSRMGLVFTALFTNRLPALLDAGFDWVDLRDVASSMIEAESHGDPGENYLLPGHYATLPQLAEIAAGISGSDISARTVPMWLARAWSPFGTALGRRSRNPLWYSADALHALRFSPPVSGLKASKVLSHSPRPLVESVRDIHDWMASLGALEIAGS